MDDKYSLKKRIDADAEDIPQRYAGTVGYDFCREVMAAIINQIERSYPE